MHIRRTVNKNERVEEEGEGRKNNQMRCSQLCWQELRALWSITQMRSLLFPLSPCPPTLQYYSVHVYKPCLSFWWHTRTHMLWHLVLAGLIVLADIEIDGEIVWQHWLISTPHFRFIHLFLLIFFSVRHAYNTLRKKITAWKIAHNSLSQILWHEG